MRRNLRRLPKRFPIGTTYVVEGHVVEGLGNEGGQLQVFSRYVVLPSGQRINLGANLRSPAAPRSGRSRARNQRSVQKQPRSAQKRWRAGEHPLGAAVNGQAPGEAPQPLTLNHPALNPGCNNSRGSCFPGPRFPGRCFPGPAFQDLLSRTYFSGPARGFRRCQIAWPITALTRVRPPSCRGEPSQCGPKIRGWRRCRRTSGLLFYAPRRHRRRTTPARSLRRPGRG